MKLKLERLGKAVCKGPLVDPGLLKEPWHIGEIRSVDESLAHQLLAKYPGLFKKMRAEDKILEKVQKPKKNENPYEDKIMRPKGVK